MHGWAAGTRRAGSSGRDLEIRPRQSSRLVGLPMQPGDGQERVGIRVAADHVTCAGAPVIYERHADARAVIAEAETHRMACEGAT